MIRKILLSIIMITFTISLLSACQLKKVHDTIWKTENDPYQEKQLTPETLTFYIPGYEPDGEKDVLKRLEKAVGPTLNVKLNFKWIPKGGYLDQVRTLINDGKSLDAFVLSKDQYSDEISAAAKDGEIIDITELLPKAAPSLYGMYSKEQLENVTYRGKLMAIPQNYPKSKRVCAVIEDQFHHYEDDYYKNIKNFEDFEKFLAGENTVGNQSSKNMTILDLSTVDAFAESYGYVHIGYNLVYKWDDPEMKLMPWEQTPEFKASIETLQRWKAANVIENYSGKGELVNGKSAIEIMSENPAFISALVTWDTAQYFINNFKTPGYHYTVLPLYEDKPTAKPVDTTAVVLGKGCKDPERVLKVLNWIQQNQEDYDLFMYGIKDKDYFLDDSRISFPKDKPRYFGWDGSDAFINIKYLREENSDTENDKEDLIGAAMKNSRYAPSYGFKPNLEKIQVEIDARNKNFGEMQKKIQEELVDVDKYVKEFIETQRNAGVDRIVTLIQEQLSQWKASKN